MRGPQPATFLRMPPGDRGPLLRSLVARQRAALDALVDEPPDDPIIRQRRTRRTRNLAKLRHIARAVGVEI